MPKKKINKKNMKFSEPYKICRNCNGNGYVRIIPYSETQTCKECKGAGHFENEKITTNQEPAIDNEFLFKLLDLIKEFIRGKKRTIH
jgi:DnaJ-class molecular chaperone